MHRLVDSVHGVGARKHRQNSHKREFNELIIHSCRFYQVNAINPIINARYTYFYGIHNFAHMRTYELKRLLS